jgi:hypothetical protein
MNIGKRFLKLMMTTLFLLVVVGSVNAYAATFTVDDSGDAIDADIGNGTCATAGAVCTLRAAIAEASATVGGGDTIQFDGAVTSLTPGSAYPDITKPMTINGGSTVTINGGNLANIFHVNTVAAAVDNKVTIQNFVKLFNANGAWIKVTGSDYVDITGNNFGCFTNDGDCNADDEYNTLDEAIIANAGVSTYITISSNKFSQNRAGAMDLASISNLTVDSNVIGFDLLGTTLISNNATSDEVISLAAITTGSITSNTIGGHAEDAIPIYVTSDFFDLTINGNKIGTFPTGNGDAGNRAGGIVVDLTVNPAGDANIGTLTIGAAGAGNVIAYNEGDGALGVAITVDLNGKGDKLLAEEEDDVINIKRNYIGVEDDGVTSAQNGINSNLISLQNGALQALNIEDNVMGGTGYPILIGTTSDIMSADDDPVTIQGNWVGLGTNAYADLVSSIGSSAPGFHVEQGKVYFGGNTPLTSGVLGMGNGNVMANVGSLSYPLKLGDSVSEAYIYGNILGLKASDAVSYDYSDNAGNWQSDIYVDSDTITRLDLGKDDDATYRNYIAGAFNNATAYEDDTKHYFDIVDTNDADVYVVNAYIGTAYDGTAVDYTNIGGASAITKDYNGLNIQDTDNDDGMNVYVGIDDDGDSGYFDRNIISGVSGSGISAFSGMTTGGTIRILRNFLGVDAGTNGDYDGQAALANDHGILCNNCAGTWYIGQDGAGEISPNTISGNRFNGINISNWASATSGTAATLAMTIETNFIGLDHDGTVALSNGTSTTPRSYIDAHAGIYIDYKKNNVADSLTLNIGGDGAQDMNLIGANYGYGVKVMGSYGTVNIDGNYIGENHLGTAFPNAVPGSTLTDALGMTQEVETLGGGVVVQDMYLNGYLCDGVPANADGEGACGGAWMTLGYDYDVSGVTITDNLIYDNEGSGIAIVHVPAGETVALYGVNWDSGSDSTQTWAADAINGNYIGVSSGDVEKANGTEDGYGIYVNDVTSDILAAYITSNTVNDGIYIENEEWDQTVLNALNTGNTWTGAGWTSVINETVYYIANYIGAGGVVGTDDADYAVPPANSACEDGADGDDAEDELIDLADPGCVDADDDDESNPTITLAVSGETISEASASSVTLTATASTTHDQDIVVSLGFSGADGDYSASASTITILTGATEGTATITAIDDTSIEDTETVTVSISSVTNAAESGTQVVSVSITSDDVGGSGFSSVGSRASSKNNSSNDDDSDDSDDADDDSDDSDEEVQAEESPQEESASDEPDDPLEPAQGEASLETAGDTISDVIGDFVGDVAETVGDLVDEIINNEDFVEIEEETEEETYITEGDEVAYERVVEREIAELEVEENLGSQVEEENLVIGQELIEQVIDGGIEMNEVVEDEKDILEIFTGGFEVEIPEGEEELTEEAEEELKEELIDKLEEHIADETKEAIQEMVGDELLVEYEVGKFEDVPIEELEILVTVGMDDSEIKDAINDIEEKPDKMRDLLDEENAEKVDEILKMTDEESQEEELEIPEVEVDVECLTVLATTIITESKLNITALREELSSAIKALNAGKNILINNKREEIKATNVQLKADLANFEEREDVKTKRALIVDNQALRASVIALMKAKIATLKEGYIAERTEIKMRISVQIAALNSNFKETLVVAKAEMKERADYYALRASLKESLAIERTALKEKRTAEFASAKMEYTTGLAAVRTESLAQRDSINVDIKTLKQDIKKIKTDLRLAAKAKKTVLSQQIKDLRDEYIESRDQVKADLKARIANQKEIKTQAIAARKSARREGVVVEGLFSEQCPIMAADIIEPEDEPEDDIDEIIDEMAEDIIDDLEDEPVEPQPEEEVDEIIEEALEDIDAGADVDEVLEGMIDDIDVIDEGTYYEIEGIYEEVKGDDIENSSGGGVILNRAVSKMDDDTIEDVFSPKVPVPIDNNSNFDNDRVADLLEFGSGKYKKDRDNDGRSDAEEIYFGSSPDKYNAPPEVLAIVNPPKVSQPFLSVRLKGKPGTPFSVIARNANTDQEYIVGEGVIDDGYKGAVSPNYPLLEGDYYVYPRSKTTIGELHKVKIVNKTHISAPRLIVAEKYQEGQSYFNIGRFMRMTMRYLEKYSDFELISYIENHQLNRLNRMSYVEVYSDPGTVVEVTWKSLILNSQLLADLSKKNNRKEAVTAYMPLEELSKHPGMHQIEVTAYDPMTGTRSDLVTTSIYVPDLGLDKIRR